MLVYKKGEPLQKLRDIIFSYFISHPEEGVFYKNELEYLRKAKTFYDFVIPYREPNLERFNLGYEGFISGFHVFDWKGSLLFLPFGINEFQRAKDYLMSIIIEQSTLSPHKYSGYKTKGKTLVDVGAAEGFFARENVNEFENVIVIEALDSWINALKRTFSNLNNVSIIKSFVNEDNGLDKLLDKVDLNNSVIKLDIEGYEMEALNTLQHKLDRDKCSNIEILVCCYHKQEAFDEVVEFANKNGFSIEVNSGYMLFVYDDLKPPFFREGVVRLWR